MKANFARTAMTAELKVNLGRWGPTEERLISRWDALSNGTI